MPHHWIFSAYIAYVVRCSGASILPPTPTASPLRFQRRSGDTHMDGGVSLPAPFPKLNTVKCFLGICIIP